jgi:hypothetical protein
METGHIELEGSAKDLIDDERVKGALPGRVEQAATFAFG